MMHRVKWIGAFALACGMACTSAPIVFRQSNSLYIDAWLQWNDAGQAYAHIVVLLPERELLLPGEPGAPDRLTVTASFVGKDGKRLVSEAWSTDMASSQAMPAGLSKQYNLPLPQAGRSELVLGILLRGRVVLAGWQRSFSVAHLPAQSPQLTEPVFLALDDPDRASLARAYVDSDRPRVRSALLFPPGTTPAADSAAVSWRIVSGSMEHARGVLQVTSTPGNNEFELELPALQPGVYGLQLQLRLGDEELRVGGGWQVVPAIHAWRDSLPSESMLQVMLSAAELQRLQSVPPEEKLLLWREYLAALHAGTPEEALALLQHRWQQASVQFIEGDRSGWRTDRGRVYIRRGVPDELDRMDDPTNAERLERWRYRRDNHVFVFRDARGTGEYVLERTNDPNYP